MGRQLFFIVRGMAGLVVLTGLFALASCAVFPNLLADKPATSTAEAVIVADRFQQTRLVEEQLQTAAAATEVAIQATAEAEAQATALAQAEATDNALATRAAAVRSTEAAATQQAAGLYTDVQKYVEAGYLTSAQGVYHALPDYQADLAQAGSVGVKGTGFSPVSFVIRSKVDYETASMSANWFQSGCGFVFWNTGQPNHYLIFAGLDGMVHTNGWVKNVGTELGKAFFAKPDLPKGSFTLTLVANPDAYYLFVGDKMVKKTDALKNSQREGRLSYAVSSGTNKDFGTRCRFSQVELWEVQP